MSLKDYNKEQIKKIEKFIRSKGVTDEKCSKDRLRYELEWIEKNSEEFRKKWEDKEIQDSRQWTGVC